LDGKIKKYPPNQNDGLRLNQAAFGTYSFLSSICVAEKYLVWRRYPMRKQYYFRPSANGFYAWDVDKLIEKSRGFSPIDVKLDQIKELDENFWYNGPNAVPTCRSIVDHVRLISEANLNYPIILSEDGRVMDGMHRVARALLLGLLEIGAVRFPRDPDPDYVDVREDDLPYD
jgi:hypothetical protein